MLNGLVGYRFAPTAQESIDYYLRNKNLGKTSLVNDAISEINICSFEPKCLPPLAKINSGDLVWHFFSPIVYTNSKETKMKRSTGTGFWKSTGKKRIIKDKSGSEIGFKRTVFYHEGTVPNDVRSPWSMHEYHITCLPHDKTTHVLCQVKYKGEDGHILYGASGSMVSHSDTTTEINTIPEVQVDQPVQDGFSLNDLSYPLNVQENLRAMDALNPNLLQQTPEVQLNQPGQNDLYLNELSNPLMNVQENLHPLGTIDPNMSYNYIVPEVQVDQRVQDGVYLNDLSYPLNLQKDLIRPWDAINPILLQQTPEVNQPGQDGFYLTELSIPMNVQENLLQLSTIDASTSFTYINPDLLQQIPEAQFNQPGQDSFYLTDLRSDPLNVQENLFQPSTIDASTSLNYINPNLLQQIPEVQVEQPLQYHTVDADMDIIMDEWVSPENLLEDHFPPRDNYDPDSIFNFAESENYRGKELLGYNRENNEELIMQENRNVYMKMALSVYDSDGKIFGNTKLVDDAIKEINILNYEPKLLPALSKIKSEDLVWYFFSPKVYKSEEKKVMKRTTASGFWKLTGRDVIIKDKRRNKDEIGIKKTLVYHDRTFGNCVRTLWIMHEYHFTCLSPDQTTHVLCKVKYKGYYEDIYEE